MAARRGWQFPLVFLLVVLAVLGTVQLAILPGCRFGGLQEETSPQLPERAAPPERLLGRFLVLASQRSGTSLLDTELDKHPCISMSPELFAEASFQSDFLRRVGFELFFGEHMVPRDATSQWFLEHAHDALPNYDLVASRSNKSVPFWQMGQKANMTLRGFDWKLDQGVSQSWRWLLPFCLKHRVKIIWLRRRNLLRQAFSAMELQRTNEAHRADGNASAARRERVTLDVQQCLYLASELAEGNRRVDDLVKSARKLGLQTLSLWYEGLVAGADGALDAVRAFLLQGASCSTPIDAVPRRPVMAKLHSRPWRQLITNLDALRSEVQSRHPEFASMLEDS